MPTLDDAPTLGSLYYSDIADDDLIQIYDTSEQKVKTLSFSQLILYIEDQTDAVADA
tara:strand:+ start:28 stop:198 length:171 start_codon:yes stop_codon:yes gene_type:complete